MKPFILLFALFPVVFAVSSGTPRILSGLWAVNGQCAKVSQRLIVEGNTLQFADRTPEAVRFFTNDAPNGDGAFHWIEEGIVSNIQYLKAEDVLVSNPSGYGYPSDAIYKRCGEK
jgi:hypothetical protein